MKLNCLPLSYIRITIHFLILSVSILLLLESCTPAKHSYYFQGLDKDTTISGFIPDTYESKIKKRDVLSIQVTSLSAAEDLMFNQSAIGGASATTPGYIVDEQGKVLFHRLGEILVEGLTRKELKQKLQKDLLPYMKEPIVNVNYLNHKVTVIGSVGEPKIIDIPREQMPLIDILVLSGDITSEGLRNGIVVIRELENQKQVKRLNLEDLSIFKSQWYYVQPNDIIYVRADEEKQKRKDRSARIQSNIGFITAGVTFIFLIVDRLTR